MTSDLQRQMDMEDADPKNPNYPNKYDTLEKITEILPCCKNCHKNCEVMAYRGDKVCSVTCFKAVYGDTPTARS